MKRVLTALAISAALALTPVAALAAEGQQVVANQSQLAPGPAAGVQKAQLMWGPTTWLIVTAVVAAVIIIAVTSGGGGHHHHATSTTGRP